MSHFSNDYFEARARFLKAAASAGARVESLKLHAQGPKGEELFIDTAVLGNPRGEKLLIHSSGIHGVEGYAGSAVQLSALSKFLSARPSSDMGVIFVHILNPFGMSWSRRVNEENVDLNRNFLLPHESYAGAPEKYKALDYFLNAVDGPRSFWPPLVFNLLRFGFNSLKQSIVQGQYDYPNGLFFGGRTLQEGPELYKSWLKKTVGSPRFALALDVHTGLGRFGEEVLFCHTNTQTPPDLGKRVTALTEPVGYKVRGGLESLTGEIFASAKWAHFTEEFGTRPMAAVLRLLREENRNFQREKIVGATQTAFREGLNPSDEKWQSHVILKGTDTFERALKCLSTM